MTSRPFGCRERNEGESDFSYLWHVRKRIMIHQAEKYENSIKEVSCTDDSGGGYSFVIEQKD